MFRLLMLVVEVPVLLWSTLCAEGEMSGSGSGWICVAVMTFA